MKYLARAGMKQRRLINVNYYFDGADLTGINLLEARELEIEQLVRAKTLYKAKLDPDMLKMIRERSPHLLKDTGRD